MPGDWDQEEAQALASGWHALNSSNLSAYEYDPDRQVLRIRFKSGRTYAYSDVPSEIVLDLEAASSPGSFFSASIKNSFSYTQV
jgi:hypothetical protein